MIKYFAIVLVVAGFCSTAQAEQNRLDQAVEACKYRGAILKQRIATGQLSRAENEQYFDKMTADQFRQFLVKCHQTDNRFVEPRAPKNTIMACPSGPPQQIVARPGGAPMSECYRCNAETKLPDINGTKICGPLHASHRKQ
ncbi:hypothetical protein IT396_01565 [Candidatus Nomurabacteria bacterium]|nr:hypothetical protein [Candidatus Nomurabacteria bacterium]